MKCNNCNFENSDNAHFCGKCGSKLSASSLDDSFKEAKVSTESVSYQEAPARNVANATEQQPAEDFAQSYEQSQTPFMENPFPEAPIPKKRSFFSRFKLLIIIIAILIICASVFVFAKDAIFFKISPNNYIKTLFSNSIKQISEEYTKSIDGIYGFNVSDKNELTLSIDAEIDSLTVDGSKISEVSGFGIQSKFGYSKDDKEINSVLALQKDKKTLASLNLMLNDEKLAIKIPELFDECLVASSRNFGEEWNESVFSSEAYIDDKLDISFSNLFKDKTISQETIDVIYDEFNSLLDSCEVRNKEKDTLSLSDKNRKVTTYDLEFKTVDVGDCFANVLDAIINDDAFKNYISSFDTSDLEDIIEAIKDYDDEDDELLITVYEYDDKIVKLDFEKEDDDLDIDTEFSIATRSSDCMINDFIIVFTDKQYDKTELTIESVGNHVPKGGIYSDKTTVTFDGAYDSFELLSSIEMNFKDNELDGNIDASIDGEDISITYSGECENKDSFRFALDSIECTELDFDFSGSLDFELIDENTVEEISVKKEFEILNADNDELISFITDIQDEIESIFEEIGLY